MSATPNRIMYLDALKGVAVLSVVLAHAIALPHIVSHATPGSIPYETGFLEPAAFRSITYNLIASVYLPLFAFVSGLIQGIGGTAVSWRLIGRRFKQLMVPYAAWTIVYGLVMPTGVLSDPNGWLRSLAAAITDPRGGALWFLYALFMSYVLAAAVSAISKRPSALLVSAVVAMFVLALPIPNVLGVRDTATLYPFFVLGLLEMRWGALRTRSAVIGSAIAYPILLATIWPTVIDVRRWWVQPFRDQVTNMGLGNHVILVWLPNFVIHFGKYFCAAAGLILVYNIYLHAREGFLRPQAWIGRMSLGIYASHRLAIIAAMAAGILQPAPIFLIAVAIAVAATLALERIPGVSQLLLGRPATPPQPSDGKR